MAKHTAILRSLVLAGALAAIPAGAHEGGTHARGTVAEITQERIVLSTTEGKRVTVSLTPGTRILRGHRSIQPSDIRAGERVVVHAAPRGGQLEATEVMVARKAG